MTKILRNSWILILILVSCSKVTEEDTTSSNYVLAFREAGEMNGIFLIDVDREAAPKPLYLDSWLPIWSIAWSPDGQSLAFVANPDGNREIYTMDLQTRTVLNLTLDPAADMVPI